MGLSIVQQLVMLMGGSITVESEPDKGSTFTFAVRFARQQEPKEDLAAVSSGQLAVPALASLYVLVAEDNEFSLHHLQRLLVRHGHHVQIVTTSREALTALETVQRPSPTKLPLATADPASITFDVLLLDIHMPELDGPHVARAIQQRKEQAREHLPVIALTARSRKEDRERCLAAGMDGYLSKPVSVPELFTQSRALYPQHRAAFRFTNPLIRNSRTFDTVRQVVHYFLVWQMKHINPEIRS